MYLRATVDDYSFTTANYYYCSGQQLPLSETAFVFDSTLIAIADAAPI